LGYRAKLGGGAKSFGGGGHGPAGPPSSYGPATDRQTDRRTCYSIYVTIRRSYVLPRCGLIVHLAYTVSWGPDM